MATQKRILTILVVFLMQPTYAQMDKISHCPDPTQIKRDYSTSFHRDGVCNYIAINDEAKVFVSDAWPPYDPCDIEIKNLYLDTSRSKYSRPILMCVYSDSKQSISLYNDEY